MSERFDVFNRKTRRTNEHTASPRVCDVLVGTRRAVSILPFYRNDGRFTETMAVWPKRWPFGRNDGRLAETMAVWPKRWPFFRNDGRLGGHGTPCPYGWQHQHDSTNHDGFRLFTHRWCLWADTLVKPYYPALFVCNSPSLGAYGQSSTKTTHFTSSTLTEGGGIRILAKVLSLRYPPPHRSLEDRCQRAIHGAYRMSQEQAERPENPEYPKHPEGAEPWGAFASVNQAAWEEAALALLKDSPLSRLQTQSLDGYTIQPLYTERPADLADAPAGFWPYRRGASIPDLPKGHWQITQRYLSPDPVATLEALRQDLACGLEAAHLSIHPLAQQGHPLPDALPTEAGACGVWISTLSDLLPFAAAFEQDKMLILEAGEASALYAALWIAALQRSASNLSDLRGTWSLDPLAAAAAQGGLRYSLHDARAEMLGLLRWSQAHTPSIHTLAIQLAPYHLAGANDAQEIAIALATGVTYLRWLVEDGLSVEEAAAQIRVSLPVTCDIFPQIAKLRALRQLWSRVLEVAAEKPPSHGLFIHAYASPRMITQRDPWVNLLRNTAALLAASAGGAQAIESAPFDSTRQLPTAFSRRMALTSHAILQEEAHLAHVHDPAGGSFFVEALTEELLDAAWSCFQDIEAQGGLPDALQSGSLQQMLEKTAQQRRDQIAKRKRPIIGVSVYPLLDERLPDAHPLDASALSNTLNAQAAAHQSAFPTPPTAESLRKTLHATTDPLARFNALLNAASQGASHQDIFSATRAQSDDPWRISPLQPSRDAAAFESLRDQSDALLQMHQKRPQALLLCFGTPAQYKARADFSQQFLAAGGIEATELTNLHTPEDALAALQAYRSPQKNPAALKPILVICSSDELYPDLIPALAPHLASIDFPARLVAGRLPAHEAAWRTAGITDTLFLGCHAPALLQRLFHLI